MHMTQWGDGCDYTIACGQKTQTFIAKNDDDAMNQVTELIRDEYADDERRLESISVYRLADTLNVNLQSIYAVIDEENNISTAEAKVKHAEMALADAKARLARTTNQ